MNTYHQYKTIYYVCEHTHILLCPHAYTQCASSILYFFAAQLMSVSAPPVESKYARDIGSISIIVIGVEASLVIVFDIVTQYIALRIRTTKAYP